MEAAEHRLGHDRARSQGLRPSRRLEVQRAMRTILAVVADELREDAPGVPLVPDGDPVRHSRRRVSITRSAMEFAWGAPTGVGWW